MSKGPGIIERRIADLFAATRDSALSIDRIAAHAFDLHYRARPTRAQRLSATRAGHGSGDDPPLPRTLVRT